MIVALNYRRLEAQCVLDLWRGKVRHTKVPQHLVQLNVHILQRKVQQPVGQKLLSATHTQLRRHLLSVQLKHAPNTRTKGVQITILQRQPNMNLVHFYRKLVLDLLHCQVLPDRTQLVSNPLVVYCTCLPEALKLVQCVAQHALRTYSRWIWC